MLPKRLCSRMWRENSPEIQCPHQQRALGKNPPKEERFPNALQGLQGIVTTLTAVPDGHSQHTPLQLAGIYFANSEKEALDEGAI